MKTYQIAEPDIQKIIGFIDLAVKAQGLAVMGEAHALLQRIQAIEPVEAEMPPADHDGNAEIVP